MISETADGLLLDILVVPRSSRAKIGPVHGDRLKVAVTAPPTDGQANAAVVALFAKALGQAKRSIELHSGHNSRRKTLRIGSRTPAELAEVLQLPSLFWLVGS